MNLTNRAKAVAKTIKGQIQNTRVNITSAPKAKAEGKAKFVKL